MNFDVIIKMIIANSDNNNDNNDNNDKGYNDQNHTIMQNNFGSFGGLRLLPPIPKLNSWLR